MAYPFVMFDNILDDATVTKYGSDADEAANPVTNIIDWRIATGYRWISSGTTSGNGPVADVNAAPQDADCGIFSGHNLSQAIDTSLTGSYTWQHSTDDITYSNAHTAAYPSDDLPKAHTWTAPGVKEYWRIRIQDTGTFEVAPQIGHAIVGKRLDFSELLQTSFSAYDVAVDDETSVNENGSLIGSNVNRISKIFNLAWDSPGLTEAGFFNPSSGLTFDGDFVTHAVDNGKPFYFVWDIDEDDTGVWICRVRSFSSPHDDVTSRRRLFMSFQGWREVS